MLGRFLERKWKEEGDGAVVMASGRVGKLPRSGNVDVREWEENTKVRGDGGREWEGMGMRGLGRDVGVGLKK